MTAQKAILSGIVFMLLLVTLVACQADSPTPAPVPTSVLFTPAETSSLVDVVALKDTQTALATQDDRQPVETDERPTGILEDPPHLEGFRDATFTTVWIAPYEGTYIKVYAGRLISDPNQGVLVVLIEGSGVIENYPSPVNEGELRIASFDQGRLQVRTEKGTDLYFDLEARLYCDREEIP